MQLDFILKFERKKKRQHIISWC